MKCIQNVEHSPAHTTVLHTVLQNRDFMPELKYVCDKLASWQVSCPFLIAAEVIQQSVQMQLRSRYGNAPVGSDPGSNHDLVTPSSTSNLVRALSAQHGGFAEMLYA